MLSSPLADVFDPKLPGISPELVAATLKVQMVDIARLAAVHRNTFARAPTSSKVQGRLGAVMRILTEAAALVMRILTEAAALLEGDLDKAIIWFRHQPLAGFEGQTAEELVADGHADAVMTHLHLLRQGSYAYGQPSLSGPELPTVPELPKSTSAGGSGEFPRAALGP